MSPVTDFSIGDIALALTAALRDPARLAVIIVQAPDEGWRVLTLGPVSGDTTRGTWEMMMQEVRRAQVHLDGPAVFDGNQIAQEIERPFTMGWCPAVVCALIQREDRSILAQYAARGGVKRASYSDRFSIWAYRDGSRALDMWRIHQIWLDNRAYKTREIP